ncbi:MAG: hypothetical protein J2O48_06520 [Solirubrobacterales bacterium]|nr:hypothetical protein [Solirubrobacterales bacterium]
MKISVLSLKVSGKLLVAQFGFTPSWPKSGNATPTLDLFDMSCNKDDAALIDTKNLKEYVPVKAQDSPLVPNDYTDMIAGNGQMTYGNWIFSAPPPNVHSINVDIGRFPPLNNVPIQR